ncbi:Lipid phosphate phosphohydrolase 3 [Toxocara canis]|uniref:Lipid phosphate phosphohydrolase 3 n=1 Tax=Toxocara canis TaxID=6265 RepID=A0A0B2UNH5_TOXCA|nr:Lipid phosphate phosphohydrolase 3 [Toxocara canis]
MLYYCPPTAFDSCLLLSLHQSYCSGSGRDWLTARDDERLLLVRSAIVMGIDICVSLLASYLVYKTITTFLIFPVERGFYCRDIQDLSSPLLPNSVSQTHLLCATLLFPFMVVLFCEGVIFMRLSPSTGRIPRFSAAVITLYIDYIVCFLLAVIVNQLCKCAIGRLRPNFLSVCNPRWERIDCSTGDMWVADAFCKGSSKAVKKARTSCPSGHATVSVLAMCFLIAYFYRILPRSSLSGLLSWIRYCVLVLFYLWFVRFFVHLSLIFRILFPKNIPECPFFDSTFSL